MADDSPVIIVVNNNIESNDSIPLLVEGVQLEEIPPATLEEHVTVSFCQDVKNHNLETPYGSIHVATQGDPTKPTILTYHDVGTNYTTCFNNFLSDMNMLELLPHFYWIHVDAPGQEDGALDFPNGYVYPTMTELAEEVGIIVESFQLSYIIGFGVGAGANILARYAILCPDRVRGLVSVNFSPTNLSWDNLSYYSDKLVSYLLKKNKFQEVAQKYLMTHSLVSHKSDRDLTAMYHGNFDNLNPHNLALFLETYSKRSSLSDEFKEIQCKCLFVFNKGFENATQLNDLNSSMDHTKTTILEIGDSGHLVLDEQPQKVAIGFRLFLQGLGHAVTLGAKSSKHSSHQLHLQGVAIH